MGIAGNEWGFRVGALPTGTRDKISDVPGVTVGHCTLADGAVQTGVTALLPHQGDIYHDKVLAASHVINGYGKTTGLVQIEELGTLETPILFTNTLSVGTAQTALVKYMLEKNPDICETTGSVNPVVCECNDSSLNDIRGLHVTEQHVFATLADCKADFAEGAVGAGRGMRCHGIKGGMTRTQTVGKEAVACGYWHLWHYNPLLEEQGKNPFVLDSKEPDWSKFREFLLKEVRYTSLQKSFPAEADELFAAAEENAKWRYNGYKRLAQMEY